MFQLIRPGAKQVYLVGDFNGWSTAASPMTPTDRCLWQLTLALPPGVYHFRYIADGQWLTDYAAYGVVRNTLGEFDSVLLVENLAPQVAADDVPPAKAQLARLVRPHRTAGSHHDRRRPLRPACVRQPLADVQPSSLAHTSATI